MKYLILLLILSCSKVTNTIIPKVVKQEERSNSLSIGPNEYNSQIDLIVAFLWPEMFRSEDKPHLKSIIKTGREIMQRKLIYQKAKFKLKTTYNEHRCPESNADICMDLEDKLAELDNQLLDIYALVEAMKEKVYHIGGEWVETNSEYPQEPLASMDFEKNVIHLTVLRKPGKHDFQDPVIINNKDYQTLLFRRDDWEIKVTPKLYSVCLLMQGELNLYVNGLKRSGFIYWEHAKLTQ